MLHFGGHNLNGSVAKFVSDEQYRELAKVMREAFSRSDLPDAVHLLEQRFGGQTYSLKNLFKDEQRKVVNEILRPILERAGAFHQELYENDVSSTAFHARLPHSDSEGDESDGRVCAEQAAEATR